MDIKQQQQRQQTTSEWVFRDVPSDIVVEVDGDTFALHKFPLVSRSGRIRKLVADRRHSGAVISLAGVPGGSHSFELAAKFCYGINFEITASNVARLICVSHYLDMSEEEDYSANNLNSRAEEYLDTVVCKNLEMCVQVLRSCEALLPLADELEVVGRCVDGIASKACVEQIASSFSRLEYSGSGRLHMSRQAGKPRDWWIEDLSSLRVDFYERVILAMKCRGVRPESIGASLAHYAEREVTARKSGAARLAVVEAVVRLLPAEKGVVPATFLFGLLRAAVAAGCSGSCRLDIERRIGMQMENATLDDLLMPNSFGRGEKDREGETLFDVESVRRMLENFARIGDGDGDSEDDDGDRSVMFDDDDGVAVSYSPSQGALFKVSKMVDSYLAEIAPDSNLGLDLFVAVIEALPGHARNVHDGLYRAIDVYLKAHHETMSESDKRRLCKLIDFQKLSHEAGAHAAQNERLPVQSVVQVLYYEQLKLRNSLFRPSYGDEDDDDESQIVRPDRWRANSGARSAAMSPRDNYASLRRENRDLKLELATMRMRLNDLEKDHVHMKRNLRKSGSNRLMRSLSKKMNIFSRTRSRRSSPSESPGAESMVTERERA